MSASFKIDELGVSETARYFGITQDELIAMIRDGAVTSEDVFRRIKGEPFDRDEKPQQGRVNPQPPKGSSPWGRQWF